MIVEETSSALVREYLSRKGLKNTLRILDEELPRSANSINNRLTLAKEIGIEKLLRRNREQEKPLLTMIEVIIQYMQQQTNLRDELANVTARNRTSVTSMGSSSPDPSVQSGSGSYWDQIDQGYREILSLNSRNEPRPNQLPLQRHSVTFSSSSPSNEPSRQNNFDRQGVYPVLQVGSSSTLPSKASRRKSKAKQKYDHNDNYDISLRSSATSSPSPSTHSDRVLNGYKMASPVKSPTTLEPVFNVHARSHMRSPPKVNGDILVINDIDEELNEQLSNTKIDQPVKIQNSRNFSSLPITLELASEIRTLIFGHKNGMFNAEWMMQSFSFSSAPGLSYGLVQYKGGPCGILAAVQAHVLRHLLFANENSNKWRGMPHPSTVERTVALASSLSDIVWKAGSCKLGVVVLPTGHAKFQCGGKFKPDQLTETLDIYSFKSHGNLLGFMAQNISFFENEKGRGCVLLLYSIILSRGIQRIKDDMDEPNGTLMGSHFFCTQEVVNLLLTGKAVSNAFDDLIELDSGGAHKSILKGIDRQSTIGFLSLFEHYDSYKVGNNYKTPRHPIWVVCSESHFSVLCNNNPDLLTERRCGDKFDLYYYDGLARQDEEIRLTVDTRTSPPRRKSNDLVPPLEHCIRTRWRNASISWNNTEPLL